MSEGNGVAGVDNRMDEGMFPEEIRDDFVRLPVGTIEWRITGVNEELTETKKGVRKTLKTELVALGPANAVGQSFTKIFWVGTKDDPEAKQLTTWTYNAMRNFKVMAAKAGVAIEGKSRALIFSELRDRKVVGKVSYPTRQDGGSPMADIEEWYEVGAVELKTEAPPARQAATTVGGAIPAPPTGLARPSGLPLAPPSAIPTKLQR